MNPLGKFKICLFYKISIMMFLVLIRYFMFSYLLNVLDNGINVAPAFISKVLYIFYRECEDSFRSVGTLLLKIIAS